MATPPVRTEISDTYPLPSNATARTGFGKLYDYVTGLLGSTGNAAEARVALGVQPTDSPSFTGNPVAPTPAVGTNNTQISTTEFVRVLKAGQLVKGVGGSSDITLTAAEIGYGALAFTGGITANINVIVPNVEASWTILNYTSGAFTLTVKTVAGTGIAISQGRRQTLWCDGISVYQQTNEMVSPSFVGTPITVTAAPGDNSLLVANTAFCATLAPAGQIAFHGRTTAPPGWLKANGAQVSRTAYANLFAAIGTTWGAGDGSTTFTLPDMRGEFPRGLDDGRGVDSGRTLGSAQADALQNITGTFAQGGLSTTTGAFANSSSFTGVGQGAQPNYIASFDASRVARTAAETRPRNMALLACIKY